MDFIPYGRQTITNDDIDTVVEVLRSDWLTQGPKILEFEAALAHYCSAGEAVAVSNATAGLHIACLALGVGPHDRVWTSPNSFLASANCARFCGASVDFVDICPSTFNMSVDQLEAKLKSAKQRNQLPKVVIPVHFAGQSCDMAGIKKLADEYGFKIIEDASHAIGGCYKNKPIGNSSFSDITIFSFHPVKIITTGEGGMALTNNKLLADKMRLLRCHGMTRDELLMCEDTQGAWYYEQIDLGFNYRITDLQCALGLNQLKRLNDFVAHRNLLAKRYDTILKDLPIQLPHIHADNYSAFHLYVIQIDAAKTKHTRSHVFNFLRKNKIGVNVHYIPIHLQPYYRNLGFKSGDFKQAEIYYNQTITLPLFYSLSFSEQDYIGSKLREAFDVSTSINAS